MERSRSLVYNTATGLDADHKRADRRKRLPTDTTLASLAAQLNSINGLSAATTPDGSSRSARRRPINKWHSAATRAECSRRWGSTRFSPAPMPWGSASTAPCATTHRRSPPAAAAWGSIPTWPSSWPNSSSCRWPAQNGATMSDLYDQMASNVTQGSSVAKSVSDSAATFASLARRPAAGDQRREHRRRNREHAAIPAQFPSLSEIHFDDQRFVERLGAIVKDSAPGRPMTAIRPHSRLPASATCSPRSDSTPSCRPTRSACSAWKRRFPRACGLTLPSDDPSAAAQAIGFKPPDPAEHPAPNQCLDEPIVFGGDRHGFGKRLESAGQRPRHRALGVGHRGRQLAASNGRPSGQPARSSN